MTSFSLVDASRSSGLQAGNRVESARWLLRTLYVATRKTVDLDGPGGPLALLAGLVDAILVAIRQRGDATSDRGFLLAAASTVDIQSNATHRSTTCVLYATLGVQHRSQQTIAC